MRRSDRTRDGTGRQPTSCRRSKMPRRFECRFSERKSESLLLNSCLRFLLGVGHANLAFRTFRDGKDGPEMDDRCRRVQFGTVDNRALRATSYQWKVRQQALGLPHSKDRTTEGPTTLTRWMAVGSSSTSECDCRRPGFYA